MAKGFLEVVGELIDDAVNPKPNRSRRRKVLDTPAAKASEDAAWEREQAKQNDKVFAAVKKAADEGEFDELVPGDIKDMGRTDAMKKAASEELGGELPDTSKSPSEPMGNVTTVVAEPKPAGEKVKFDASDVLDEADTVRRVRATKAMEEFDELVPGDFTDMGRTNAMEEAASEEFGGEFPDTSKSPSEPMGNVTTVVAEPKPAGEKARFDGVDILDEADIARRADVPQETLAALFKKTHGGSFDPKSKVDKAKMATITSMIGEDRDLLNLSPTQFALRVYARKK